MIWLCRKAYTAVKNNISDPIRQNIDGLSEAISSLAQNVEQEKQRMHEHYSKVVEKLDDHEEKIGEVENAVIKHDERIRTLFKKDSC